MDNQTRVDALMQELAELYAEQSALEALYAVSIEDEDEEWPDYEQDFGVGEDDWEL